MRKSNYIAKVLAVTVLFTFTLFAQSITKYPYLIMPGDTNMVIRIETDGEVECNINYGFAENELVKNENGTLRGIKENYYLYEFNLTDLVAGKKYFYQVSVGNIKSDILHFTTFKKEEKNIHFAAMGDSRSHPNDFEMVMQNVKQSNPNFIISMGDLVKDGGIFSEWNKYFFNVAKDIITNTPFVSALGDHEGNDDNGELFRHFFKSTQPFNKQWFSFDYGNAHFIALDYRWSDSREMMNWFVNDIIKTKARWKIVYMHRPSYNFSEHQSAWGQDKWPKVFRDFKVDLVFAGHSHIYERFYPMAPANEPDSWPVTYITTGGAGAGMSRPDKYESIASVSWKNHFVDVAITGDTLKLKTIGENYSIIDSLNIIKEGDTHNNKYLNQVRDQNIVNLESSFIRAIALKLNYLPTNSYDVPSAKLELYSNMNSDIPFSIILADESKKYYKMPLVREVLPANSSKEVNLKIMSKVKISLGDWDKLVPILKIKLIYTYNSHKDSLISIPAYYSEDGYGDENKNFIYAETDGTCIMEAENAHLSFNGDLKGWEAPFDGPIEWYKTKSINGYVGSGYMTTPNNIALDAKWEKGAELSWKVNIKTSGEYFLAVRKISQNENDNSAFIGIDSLQKGEQEFTSTESEFTWRHSTSSLGNLSVGLHKIQIRRSEDGLMLDRIMIATNPNLLPPDGSTEVGGEENRTVEKIEVPFPEGGVELLLNNYFDSGKNNWDYTAHENSVTEFSIDDSNVLEGKHSAHITISKQGAGKYNWEIGLFQHIAGGVEEGKTYYIQYQAKANKAATLETWVQQWHDNFDPIYSSELALTTEPQTFIDTFIVTSSDPQVVWGFELGAMGSNIEVWIDAVHFIEYAVTDVKTKKKIGIKNYRLKQNYPNPFNPTTIIDYALPKFSNVLITVYNTLGQKITELVNKEMQAGEYQIIFNASNLSNGIYYYSIVANNFRTTKKMIILK